MQILDRFTPELYTLIKRNPNLRKLAMPLWQRLPSLSLWYRSCFKGATFMPVPTGVCNSLKDWTQNHSGSYQVIYPSEAIVRELPKTIDKTVHWKFRTNQYRQLPETFVATIPNGRVWGDGSVITPDNYLVAKVSKVISKGEYKTNALENPIFYQEKLPPVRKVSGKLAVLSCPGGTGYYHWLFDVLPRLSLIQAAGMTFEEIDRFVINRYVSRFQSETLTIMGIPREKIIESHWYPHLEAEQLIVPALPGETSHIPKWACQFLRNTFLGDLIKSNTKSTRLYLNRAQVAHRRVENEPQIIDLLGDLGFRSVTLEELSVVEQARLLASAEIVIAPHGAGLSNIVFCQPGTKVIELLSPQAVNFMYWTLSDRIGLDYYYLLGKGEIPPEPIDPYANNENISFDLSLLAQALQLAEV